MDRKRLYIARGGRGKKITLGLDRWGGPVEIFKQKTPWTPRWGNEVKVRGISFDLRCFRASVRLVLVEQTFYARKGAPGTLRSTESKSVMELV